MRLVGSMSSDFGQAEAQRQSEVRARKRAEFREKAAGKIRQWLKSLALLAIFIAVLTHRTELQQFISLKYNQVMASRGQAGNSGSLQRSAFNHEDEVNQASQ